MSGGRLATSHIHAHSLALTESTPAPGMFRVQIISLDVAQGPASSKPVLTSLWGVEGWGAGTSLPGTSPTFLGTHAFLPPCLSLAITISGLQNLLCCAPAHSPWCQWPGSQPGNPQHPQSPEGSGQLGQRKLGDLWALTSWGAEKMETGPLHRAELQSPTPQRLCSEKTEVVKRTGRHMFGDPAAGRGHSDRAFYIRLTFSKPPGSYHHPHFTDEKTKPPTQLFFEFV